VLPKGTPVAQCLPVKRETWAAQTLPFSKGGAMRVHEVSSTICRETGVNRRQFRS
jgi:hypothetical protein